MIIASLKSTRSCSNFLLIVCQKVSFHDSCVWFYFWFWSTYYFLSNSLLHLKDGNVIINFSDCSYFLTCRKHFLWFHLVNRASQSFFKQNLQIFFSVFEGNRCCFEAGISDYLTVFKIVCSELKILIWVSVCTIVNDPFFWKYSKNLENSLFLWNTIPSQIT